MTCPTCHKPLTPQSYNQDDFNSNREDFSYGQLPEVCEDCEAIGKAAVARMIAAIAPHQ